jgi:anion transporter
LALFIFSAAVIAWTTTKWDATMVAVLAAFAMAATGLQGEKQVLYALGDPFIMLLIGGFMMGGAFLQTGLSVRLANFFAAQSRSVSHLFYLLTTVLILLSFVIPATSGRAAVMAPVYLSIAAATDNRNIRRALALLFPTIIVLSCVTNYLGAGANIMTADIVRRLCGTDIGYLDWLLLGLPVGLLSCYGSTWILLRVFLTQSERVQSFALQTSKAAFSEEKNAAQRRTVAIMLALLALWTTERLHGIEPGTVALGGAMLLCLPQAGVMKFKEAVKSVEWTLILFMAATIEISDGLIASGAIAFLMDHIQGSISGSNGWVVVAFAVGLSLLSHLVITSRTARVTVLLPLLITLAGAGGQSAFLLAFAANAAMGYCLTLPMSAKPVAMFSGVSEDSYSAKDLLHLSAWLLPVHLGLFVGLYYWSQWLF